MATTLRINTNLSHLYSSDNRSRTPRKQSALPTSPVYSPSTDKAFTKIVESRGGVLTLAEVSQSLKASVASARSASGLHQNLRPAFNIVIGLEASWADNLNRIVKYLWEERRDTRLLPQESLPCPEDVTFRVYGSDQVKLGSIERAVGELHLALMRLINLLNKISSQATLSLIVRMLSSSHEKDLDMFSTKVKNALRDVLVAISIAASENNDASFEPLSQSSIHKRSSRSNVLKAATAGNDCSSLRKAEEMHALAEQSLHDQDAIESSSAAFRLFYQAAHCSNSDGSYYAPSWYRLGLLYQKGHGTNQDLTLAVSCFRTAAGLAESGAEDALVVSLASTDVKTAKPSSFMSAHRFEKADQAKGRYPLPYPELRALGVLARCYACGSGVGRNPQLAATLYLRAAQEGLLDSMLGLGELLERGSVEASGSSQHMAANPTAAMRWYEAAAGQGSIKACNALGNILQRGIAPSIPRDVARAVQYYREAAQSGYAAAQNNLGVCYESGIGVPCDMSEAKLWYCKAANAGHASATANLAMMLWRAGDKWTAWHAFHRAVSLGEAPDALYSLGVIYEQGVDYDSKPSTNSSTAQESSHTRVLQVIPNPAMALDYLERAARQNHIGAMLKLAHYANPGKSYAKDSIASELRACCRSPDMIDKLSDAAKGLRGEIEGWQDDTNPLRRQLYQLIRTNMVN